MLLDTDRCAQAPNKSLQRARTHKLLGRGRPIAVRDVLPPRPRAEMSVHGR